MSCFGPFKVPTGVEELARETAARISSSESPRAAAASGSACTRIANFCAPKIVTCATPGNCDSACPTVMSPYSLTVDNGSVVDPSETNRTGKSAGFTLRKLGGMVISIGSRRCAMVKAVCTSSAAPSIFRLRSNWMVMTVKPCVELEDIDEMPAMVESWRSIGPAMDATMVSALAPGKVAVTAMVGKSTLGSAETGRSRKPNTPNAMIEAVINVVMTGRRIHSSERVIDQTPDFSARGATGVPSDNSNCPSTMTSGGALADQVAEAPEIALRALELGLILGEHALGLFDLGVDLAGIESKQEIAFTDLRAVFEMDRDDGGFDPRFQRDAGNGRHRSDRIDIDRHGLAFSLGQFNRDHARALRSLGARSAAHPEPARREGRQGNDAEPTG